MKTRYTVALSVLAGLAVGAAAVETLHAQAKPPAYVVAEIEVTNLTPYDKEYVPAAMKAKIAEPKLVIDRSGTSTGTPSTLA